MEPEEKRQLLIEQTFEKYLEGEISKAQFEEVAFAPRTNEQGEDE